MIRFMTIVACLLFLEGAVQAQNKSPLLLLEKGRDYWLAVKYDQALALYEQVIKEYPHNKPALMEAYYKSGVIYDMMEKYAQAWPFFQKMIAMDVSSKEKNTLIMRTFMQRTLKPYQQYMHLAYAYLGNISQVWQKYQQAVSYYQIAEKKYPSWDQNTDFSHLFTSELYAECYTGLQKTDSVLYALIPYILTSEEYAAEGLESLKKNLKKIVEVSTLKKDFQQALSAITIEEKVVNKQYVYQLNVQLLGKKLFLYKQTYKTPLLPFQQKKEIDKCQKELQFIFQELQKTE